jgi:dienelactone hydrolase
VWREFGSRPEVDEKRVALMGASMGANLALNAAAAEPGIPTVVLLSPGLNYNGVTTNQALEQLGRRRILVIASRADNLVENWPAQMLELAPGNIQLKLVAGNAHGSRLLDAPSGLERTAIQWLSEGYKRQAPVAPRLRPSIFVVLIILLAGLLGIIVILYAAWLYWRTKRR